ncbi:MAG: LuxR C-terminal-related transcriptional regulator [Bacteroidota bacterium]|nr:LuxR C-terminal-related transcriptional regulator [Bacteroidota bacterium]MDP4232882.1 LuxR C-terminal-related transcriptional regulator [Bacteroidota bacterium]MDP4241926.1 LuxR C-terminal-related transcriptional regulator [Bacteroidota bacterium]MDP4286829.1 LuxR C-terminal-related transcriptional regulator [Bacteroidota bacterium]
MNALGARDRAFSLLEEAEALQESDCARSVKLCLEAVSVSQRRKDKQALAVCYELAGAVLHLHGEYERSIRYSKKAIALYESSGHLEWLLHARYELGVALSADGQVKEASIIFHQLLEMWTGSIYGLHPPKNPPYPVTLWRDRYMDRTPTNSESLQNYRKGLALLYNEIGLCYRAFGERNKAIKYLQLSLKLEQQRKNVRGIVVTLGNLGGLYLERGDRALSARSNARALQLSRQIGNQRGVAFCLLNMAYLEFATRRMESGRRHAARAIQTFLTAGLKSGAAQTALVHSEFERQYGSIQRASQLNRQALEWLKGNEEGEMFLTVCFQQLVTEHAMAPSAGVLSKLVQLHERASKKGSDQRHEIAREIARIAEELGLHADALQWNKAIHGHDIEQAKVEETNALLGIEAKQEIERLAKEKELSDLKLAEAENQIRSKNIESELLLVQLSKKSSFLSSFADELKAMKHGRPPAERRVLDDVIRLIESMRFKDQEYERLEDRAKSLQPDFVIALSKQCPELTTAERRVCILMRLGLNSKEIAGALFSSVRTVETHRLRIRRKLKIPEAITLPRFLGNIVST